MRYLPVEEEAIDSNDSHRHPYDLPSQFAHHLPTSIYLLKVTSQTGVTHACNSITPRLRQLKPVWANKYSKILSQNKIIKDTGDA